MLGSQHLEPNSPLTESIMTLFNMGEFMTKLVL